MFNVSTRTGLLAAVVGSTLATGALAQEQLYSLSNPTSPILRELDPVSGGELSAAFTTGAGCSAAGVGAGPQDANRHHPSNQRVIA